MLQPFSFLKTTIRNLNKRVYHWPDGIKYPGFTYYPRRPDFQDPPYEPSKLFRVRRIKPIKGTPYWEREILKRYKLDGKLSDISIVKNIPEVNAELWKIKHLIDIQPITFPCGLPDGKSMTQLKENGELVVKHLSLSEERLKASDDFINDRKRLDKDTLRRHLRKVWLNGWDSP